MEQVICPDCGELSHTGGLFTTCDACKKVFETSKALPVPVSGRPRHPSDQTYRLRPPPREVPLPVRIHLVFGGVYGLIGWLFITVGAPMFWLLASRADVSELLAFRGQTEQCTGLVCEVTQTLWTEGNRSSSGSRVYRHGFTFAGPEGETLSGTSYSRGTPLEMGTPCAVEYPSGKPELARIKGMRRGMLPVFVAAPLSIHLAMGLVFALLAARNGRRAVWILTVGRPAMGTLTSKRPGMGRVNGRQVYVMTFSYQAVDGRSYETVVKTHEPDKLEDAAEECLVYDPDRPDQAVLVDALPGPPRITTSGLIESSRPTASWCMLIPVILAVLAHVILGAWRLTQ